MKVGRTPLAVSVMVAASRLMGSDLAADVLGCMYLVVITVMMSRGVTRGRALAASARL
jgi:hypothetical protein